MFRGAIRNVGSNSGYCYSALFSYLLNGVFFCVCVFCLFFSRVNISISFGWRIKLDGYNLLLYYIHGAFTLRQRIGNRSTRLFIFFYSAELNWLIKKTPYAFRFVL
jgi:hypothetical protein